MPEFSNRSIDRLSECHDDLVTLFTRVIARYDCTVLCGHRGAVAQNRAYADDKSTVMWPKSKHNQTPSMAADVVPWPVDWEDAGSFYIFIGWVLNEADRLYREGKMTHRVRNGSDWDMDGKTLDQKFNDLAHWELI